MNPAAADGGREGSVEPLLVSIHLPKTAGSTLGGVLEKVYGARFQRAYETEPPHRVEAPACIHGHAVFPRFREVIANHPHVRWLTFLRDPLAGAISHYHFTRERWGRGPGAHFQDRGLIAWLTHDEEHRWPDPPGYRHDRYSDWLRTLGRDLDDFDFVGITEAFERSLFLLFRRMNWAPVRYRSSNRGRYDREPPPNWAISEFRRLNRADYELYERAKTRLKDLERELGADLGSALRAFLRATRPPPWSWPGLAAVGRRIVRGG